MLVEVSEIPEDTIDVPFDDARLIKICQDMKQVCESENGIGLSAVQIGIPWKLFVVRGDGSCPHIPLGEYGYFANCEYKQIGEDDVVSVEGCLSIKSPDGQSRRFQVIRHRQVEVTGLRINPVDASSEEISWVLDVEEQGVVFQHEIDHHFSVLISDIGKEIFIWQS